MENTSVIRQTAYIFGNPDIASDSIPFRILPGLKESFPYIDFEIKDPNEEWEVPEDLLIIDTTVGINEVTVFHDLDAFAKIPSVSMHDFDALTNLRYMKKLGKLRNIEIIGIPSEISDGEALSGTIKAIEQKAAHRTARFD